MLDSPYIFWIQHSQDITIENICVHIAKADSMINACQFLPVADYFSFITLHACLIICNCSAGV